MTLDIPPNSTHFDMKHQLKAPSVMALETSAVNPTMLPAQAIPGVPIYTAPPPLPYFHTFHHPPPYNSYPPSQFSPPPHWGQPYPYSSVYLPAPFFAPPQLPAYPEYGEAVSAASPVPSLGVAAIVGVMLDTFCDCYGVSSSDQAKLARLEYLPGERAVEDFAANDWEKVEFTTLGWKQFLISHKHFISDVKSGTWVPPVPSL